MTTIKQLAGVTAVKRALQDITEGKFIAPAWSPPTWWRTPEQQLDRARQLWPNVVLPEPPKKFIPRTKSEVLLLHVPDSFGSLWDKVATPRWENVKVDNRNLRLAPNKVEYTEPVWLAFDPEHGKGKRPDSFWGQANIAASEVLSALIQFPEWPFAWLNGASAPYLAGYQLRNYGNWLGVPCLRLSLWGGPWVELCNYWADHGVDCLSSPLVREC